MGAVNLGLRAVARVLILNEAGELLLCRSRNGKAWVAPGGTLDPGESLPEAAAREALEEAGLKVQVEDLVFLQEFRPARSDEHVLEAAFRAATRADRPDEAAISARAIQPAGPAERPWAAWSIQDVDGPRREVRWFSQSALASAAEPVYPEFLRRTFWQVPRTGFDPYLGLVSG